MNSVMLSASLYTATEWKQIIEFQKMPLDKVVEVVSISFFELDPVSVALFNLFVQPEMFPF